MYLIAENNVLFEMNSEEVPVCLLAAFYVFNMQYPCDQSYFFIFLSISLFGIKPKKIPAIVESLLLAL